MGIKNVTQVVCDRCGVQSTYDTPADAFAVGWSEQKWESKTHLLCIGCTKGLEQWWDFTKEERPNVPQE